MRVLGPVRLLVDDTWVVPATPQLRLVLGLMALRIGHVVPVEELADAIWDAEPPRSARASLQSLMTRLRYLLKELPGASLTRVGDGYLLELDHDHVDAGRFRALGRSGRAADRAAAIPLFDAALALWNGPALADAPDTQRVRAIRHGLAEEHLSVLQDRLACMLACGREREAAAELPAALASYPLNERLAGMLMASLYRSGQRADALSVFRQTRSHLVAELGVEPGAELQLLHQRILAGDASLTAPPPPPGRTGSPQLIVVGDQQEPSAGGQQAPSAGGQQAPSADRRQAFGAGGQLAFPADGRQAFPADGQQLTRADGQLTPAAGQQLTLRGEQQLTRGGGPQLTGAGGERAAQADAWPPGHADSQQPGPYGGRGPGVARSQEPSRAGGYGRTPAGRPEQQAAQERGSPLPLRPWHVPRQLPTAPAQFVDRAAELARLDELIVPAAGLDGRAGGETRIRAIVGLPGVGKSALATVWAHRAAGHFPAGQLYVNLKGYGPAGPLPPEQAIRGFLQALGVPSAELPES